MEEKHKELLSQGLEKALEFIEKTADFASEQTPLLIQEILTYGLWSESSHLLISMLTVLAGSGLIYIAFKVDIPDAEAVGAIGGMGVMAILLGSFIFLINVQDVLKVWLAPRLYLIEYLKDLL